MIISDATEMDAIRQALVHGLAVNIYDYKTENAAKRILRDHFPNTIVKRGNPPTYGRDLKIKKGEQFEYGSRLNAKNQNSMG